MIRLQRKFSLLRFFLKDDESTVSGPNQEDRRYDNEVMSES